MKCEYCNGEGTVHGYDHGKQEYGKMPCSVCGGQKEYTTTLDDVCITMIACAKGIMDTNMVLLRAMEHAWHIGESNARDMRKSVEGRYRELDRRKGLHE
jgi:hypothetical protein